MVVPVSNPSKKKRNLNIGAAPAKLEDEGGQGRVSSDYQIEGMLKQAKPAAKLKGKNPDPLGKKFIEDEGGQGRVSSDYQVEGVIKQAKPPAKLKKKTPSSDPTGAPKQTLLQKQKQTADRIRAGGKSKPKAAPAPASIAKPKPKAKPFIEDEGGQGRVSSDYQIEGMIKQARKPKALTAKPKSKPKPKAKGAPEKSITKALQTNLGRSRTAFGQSDDTGPSKTGPSKRAKKSAPTPPAKKVEPPAKLAESKPRPAAPKLAPRPKPKPAVRKRADTGQRLDSRGSGKDADLFDIPAGVTSGKSPKVDDGYRYYGKEGTGLGDFSRKYGIKYATPEQFEKDFNMDDGEKRGGRPGKSKMKTQGLNRSKRSGFSGRGTGAALRGF